VNIDIPISMDNDIKKNNNFFVKSTMLKINKILEEYADYVEKLETYKDIVFKDKFVEKSITNIDSSNKTLISGIRNFKEEMDKKKIDKCEQDNLELMEEIDQLKKQLRDKENAFFELKNEFQKMKNQCDNISTLDKLVKEKQELVQLYVSRLDKIKKDKFDLETNLGNVRAQLKLKETEFQLVFDVFENMLEKKSSSHSSYQRNLQKLDGDSRGKIEQLCRTYKVFKK
jgi:seryl-tRNA synthetase